MAGLHLEAISKTFGTQTAVERMDLSFGDGELTALLGPSGCGKTTLLRMIAGLETPSTGRIMLGDTDVTAHPAHKRKFGMVFQNFALFPHLNVRENVGYALTIAGVSKSEAGTRADRLLDLVQLTGFADRRIGQLSGGQRQRVAIARALAQEPDIFLLDEPMSALDAKLREEMQVELRLLQQRLGITTIVVTHDQREAMTMADQIVVMSKGRLEQVAPPDRIYNAPANSFVAEFIGKANFLRGTVRDAGVVIGDSYLPISPPPRFINGSPVQVVCRPEQITLTDAAPLMGEVVFVRDLGASREIHLNTPIGTLVAELAATMAPTALKKGDRVGVHLPVAALHLFPDGAAPDQTAMAAE